MAIYELSVGDYDGHTSWLLEHDDKTPGQFEVDCHKVIREVGEDVIANEHYSVSVYDWIKAAVNMLESWGYEHIKPIGVSFNSEQLNCVDEDSEWRTEVGEELYDKAVKAGFDHWTKRCADSDYFISVDDHKLYHRSDCPVFQKLWNWKFYTFHKESFDLVGFKDYKPCSVCFGEGEKCVASEQQSQSDDV